MPEITYRNPLWLAVAITVVVSVPFGTLIGKYNVALWASFIAWAEYFAFGATPDQLKWIYGLFPLGALTMAIFATFNNYFVVNLGWDLVGSATLWLFIWVAFAVWLLMQIPKGLEKGLAFFNGLSMYLALYFAQVSAGLGAGPLTGSTLGDPWIFWLWISLAGVFGGYLGWFNVEIAFPKIDGEAMEKKWWEVVAVVATFIFSALLWIFFHPDIAVLSGTASQFIGVIVILWILILAAGLTAISEASE